MRKDSLDSRALELALRAKRNTVEAARQRCDQEDVFGRARAAAYKVLKEGGKEVDALMAASMSLFYSFAQTCGSEGEAGVQSFSVMLPSGEQDIMTLFTSVAAQAQLSPVAGMFFLALMEAGGCDVTRTLTPDDLMEHARRYADVVGVHNFEVVPGNLEGGGGH
jgi:hypothetical protein